MAMISVDLPGVVDEDILYHYRLGIFHAVWATIDVNIDFAISQFLNLPHEEGHLVTWGMMHGPKIKLLAKLVRNSDHPRKREIMTAINSIRSDTKRDIIAHAYHLYGEDQLAFLERSRSSNDFTSKLHEFTHAEFRTHVNQLIVCAHAFSLAMNAPFEQVTAFVEAARSLSKSAKTSPKEPASKSEP